MVFLSSSAETPHYGNAEPLLYHNKYYKISFFVPKITNRAHRLDGPKVYLWRSKPNID